MTDQETHKLVEENAALKEENAMLRKHNESYLEAVIERDRLAARDAAARAMSPPLVVNSCGRDHEFDDLMQAGRMADAKVRAFVLGGGWGIILPTLVFVLKFWVGGS